MNPLVLTLFFPLLGFLISLFVSRRVVRTVALSAAGLSFLSSLALIVPVRQQPSVFTSIINWRWIDPVSIRFHLGLDGISLWLVLLTTLLVPLAMWTVAEQVRDRRETFLRLLLLFEFGLIGVFSALDLFTFYVFWEVALVPMYLLVGGWGGNRRTYAAVKFFVYTFAGSVLMLASIIYLSTLTGTFDYQECLTALNSGNLTLSSVQQLSLFVGFFLAFAIKVPVVPLHTWLPVTYNEAPGPAVLLLAAVMSKMGSYGLLRYCLPLFPAAAHRCAGWIVGLAISGIVYGALVALVQPNLKRLIGYSSISHLGFVVLGIFTFTQQGLDGAVYQMVAHGVSTGALFLLAGYLERRRNSTEIVDFGGVAGFAPRLAAVFMLALLASIGLPSLSNFIGEYLVLQGAAIAHFAWAVWAAIGVILSAAYMLWMYQQTFLGTARANEDRFPDLSRAELGPLLPLLFLMIWLGSYTESFLPPITQATARLLEQTRAGLEYRVHVGAQETRLIPADSKRLLHAQ